jgi:hypothetical protein
MKYDLLKELPDATKLELLLLYENNTLKEFRLRLFKIGFYGCTCAGKKELEREYNYIKSLVNE